MITNHVLCIKNDELCINDDRCQQSYGQKKKKKKKKKTKINKKGKVLHIEKVTLAAEAAAENVGKGYCHDSKYHTSHEEREKQKQVRISRFKNDEF